MRKTVVKRLRRELLDAGIKFDSAGFRAVKREYQTVPRAERHATTALELAHRVGGRRAAIRERREAMQRRVLAARKAAALRKKNPSLFRKMLAMARGK